MSSRIIVFAAAGIAAIGVAAPVLAQSNGGGQTITFRELNKGSRFKYIDNPPKNPAHRRPTFSVGDEFVLANPLADDSGKIGELRATCTITKKAPGNDAGLGLGHPFCTGAFLLKGGTLFVETVDAGGKVTSGGVVGGTGAYVGARGTFTSTTTKTGADDTVHLLP
ncbi:MAG: hypothetical protein ACXVFK_10940 [Solirubrobacteraceae bacterium]